MNVLLNLFSWLQALRLQFYPMTLIAYGVGAMAAVQQTQAFDSGRFWLGYAARCSSSKWPRCWRTTTSATKAIGKIPMPAPLPAAPACWSTASSASVRSAEGSSWLSPCSRSCCALCSRLRPTLLAMGYTVPPLKLSHRGLGELVVALTHSIGVILPGYLLQGGDWHDPLPWLLGLPLGLAVLPATILSGVPDYDADAAAGKNTLVVKLGIRGALIAATLLPILAVAAALFCRELDGMADAHGYWIYLAVPHAAWLSWRLGKYLRQRTLTGRIDGLMALALTSILWFGAIPLIRLW